MVIDKKLIQNIRVSDVSNATSATYKHQLKDPNLSSIFWFGNVQPDIGPGDFQEKMTHTVIFQIIADDDSNIMDDDEFHALYVNGEKKKIRTRDLDSVKQSIEMMNKIRRKASGNTTKELREWRELRH